MNVLEQNIHKIRKLCAKHKVNTLFVFGSILNNTFSSKSDIDLIVDFDPIDINEYADNYFDLKERLESLLRRPLDLLEEKGIHNPILRKQIDSEKKLLY